MVNTTVRRTHPFIDLVFILETLGARKSSIKANDEYRLDRIVVIILTLLALWSCIDLPLDLTELCQYRIH